MTKDEFICECNKIGISLSGEQIQYLDTYMNLLIEWNDKFNLTSILKKEDIYLKHFYDSLCIVKAADLKKELCVCDFGTGAGFPGIVLAIIFRNIKVDLIESNGKKVKFLSMIKEVLNLNNTKIIEGRMEDYAKFNGEKYDVVTCRAVSNLGIISELSVATVKIGGIFVPLKSSVDEEVLKYGREILKLGYKIEKIIEYTLPFENAKRTIPILKKIKTTEQIYPRSYNIILSKYK